MTSWVKLEVGGRVMNEIKSLFDKKYYDLSVESPYTHRYIYIYLSMFITFYLSIFLKILSHRDNIVHLEFHLLLLISASPMSRYQDKDSNSVHTNKHPDQR